MPVVVLDYLHLSSSPSLYSQKLKEKESSRAQVFEILKISLKNRKERSLKKPRQDDPRKHKPEEEN